MPHKGTNALCFRLFSWLCCSSYWVCQQSLQMCLDTCFLPWLLWGVLLLLPWSYPERQFVPCERGALSQAQTVVQGMTMVTGEQHLREVMEGNRYPDTSVKTASTYCMCLDTCYLPRLLWGVLLLLPWSHLEQQFVPVKGRLFHRHKLLIRVWPQ